MRHHREALVRLIRLIVRLIVRLIGRLIVRLIGLTVRLRRLTSDIPEARSGSCLQPWRCHPRLQGDIKEGQEVKTYGKSLQPTMAKNIAKYIAKCRSKYSLPLGPLGPQTLNCNPQSRSRTWKETLQVDRRCPERNRHGAHAQLAPVVGSRSAAESQSSQPAAKYGLVGPAGPITLGLLGLWTAVGELVRGLSLR